MKNEANSNKDLPAYFKYEPTQALKETFKKSYVSYILDNNLEGQPPKPNKQLCLKIISYFANENRPWKKVNDGNFNKKHPAIRHYYDTLDNLHESKHQLKKYIKQAKAEEEGKTPSEASSSDSKEAIHLQKEFPSEEQSQSEKAQIQSKPLTIIDKADDQTPKQVNISELFPDNENGYAKIKDCGHFLGQKRPAIETVESLYNEWQLHKKQALKLESDWRAARDSLMFIKTPQSDEKKHH